MALKNEFDNKSYLIVLVRSLTGALVGALPGCLYIFATGHNLATDSFGVGLIQMGAITGSLALGLAATAGVVVAALKSRGTGPTGKAHRLKEYLNPDTLPVIPPSTKPPAVPKDSESTEVTLPALPATAPVVQPTPAVPAIVQPEQPVFEDFDRG